MAISVQRNEMNCNSLEFDSDEFNQTEMTEMEPASMNSFEQIYNQSLSFYFAWF